MKVRRNFSGFSVVEALVVLGVVSILGFCGWYVWQSRLAKGGDSATTAPTSTTDTPTSASDESAAVPIPEGYTEYSDDLYGFAFAYPKDWGSASVSEESPGRIVVIFTAHDGQVSHYNVTLHKESIEHLDTDSPTLNITGFTFSDSNLTISQAGGFKYKIAVEDVLKSSNDSVVYLQGVLDAYSVTALKHVEVKDYKVAIFVSPEVSREDDKTAQINHLVNLVETFRAID